MARNPSQTPEKQAALVLLYGATAADQEIYPLVGDAIVVGKHPSCDLVMKANDVSSLHCVISRRGNTFAVRDCKSRSGILINGERVYEGILHDEDVLKIGPFSFKVVIPPETRSFGNDREMRMDWLEWKRRNLLHLAWRLRSKVLALRSQLDARDRRAGLPSPRDTRLDDTQVLPNEGSVDRDGEFADTLRLSRDEQQAISAASLPPVPRPPECAEPSQLQSWRHELELYAQRLEEIRQAMATRHDAIVTSAAARSGGKSMENDIAQEKLKELEAKEQALREVEARLQSQRQEIVGLIAELKQLQAQVKHPADTHVKALEAENEQLRQRLASYESQSVDDSARSDIAERLDQAMREIEQLRSELAEKDDVIAQLQESEVPGDTDPADLEAELVQFRRELEEQREELRREMELLRQKDEELDEVGREMELELSRERAQIARERSELERLRAEVQGEMQRLERLRGVGDKLAGVQKLRQQIGSPSGGNGH